MIVKAIFLVTTQLLVVCTTFTSGYSEHQHGSLQRVPRSIKNTFPKDAITYQSKVVARMANKISSLENSVEHIDNKVKEIETQNEDLEKSLNEQKVMLQQLDEDVISLGNLLSLHSNSLDELKQWSFTDEDEFAFLNESCGGVLHAQSGFAVYKNGNQSLYSYTRVRSLSTLSNGLNPSCVWTIQADRRSVIRLTVNLMEIPNNIGDEFPNGIYAIEGIANVAGTETMEQTRVTKLLKDVTYSFKGPLLYIVLYISDAIVPSLSESVSLQFEYKSAGQDAQKNGIFSHKHIYANSPGSRDEFNDKDYEKMSLGRDSSSSNTTSVQRTFTSVIISNFTTMVRLQTVWEKERCSNDTIMMIFPVRDILFNTNTTSITNLCKIGNKPVETNLLTSHASPIMMLISKPVTVQVPFNVTWTYETPYPTSYINAGNLSQVLENTPCGSVLGGNSGIIYYKRYSRYRNGERCVWIIRPQPAPRNYIKISFNQATTSGSYNSKEANNYDHVYMLELTNIDGEERVDGPKVTKLMSPSIGYEYNATSREVYIVFYSDFTVTSTGFDIMWIASGDVVNSGNDVSTRFNFISANNGTIELGVRDSTFFNVLYQVFVFIPTLPSDFTSTSSYVFGMNFQLDQGEVESIGDNFLNSSSYLLPYRVFAPSDTGFLQERENIGFVNHTIIENADGMLILIFKNTATIENHNIVPLNFSWQKEPESNDAVIMENNKCGGVMIGNRGILRYKLEQKYNRNEHCLWLVQSPNSTYIELKLIKDGFGVDDRLFINTIDEDAGTLKNDTVELRTPFLNNNTISGSVLVVSFRPSSTSTNGTGFLLQFWSSNDTQEGQEIGDDLEDIDYRLRHSELHSGRFLYNQDSQVDLPSVKQLHVIAYSVGSVANVADRPKSTNVNWTSGVFKKDNQSCAYDSISFYTTLSANLTDTTGGNDFERMWKQTVFFPGESDIEMCPNQVKVANRPNILIANYTAFLVIYKLVAHPVETDFGGDDRRIDFTHTQTLWRVSSNASLEVESDDDLFDPNSPFYRNYGYHRRYWTHYLLRRYNRDYGWTLPSHISRRVMLPTNDRGFLHDD